MATALDQCLGGWDAAWEDLDASGRADYRLTCEEGWEASRAALEARQIPVAEAECTAAAGALDTLGCPELRVLYAP